MIESLDVMLWGKKVGTLVSVRKGYGKRICFYFDQSFVKSGLDIAPLRAPLTGALAMNSLPVFGEEDRSFGGLPSFIADSMPDHWGNTIFNEWAKVNNIRQKDLTVLDRLAYIGRRGMGALEFVPPVGEAMEEPFRVDISRLSELAGEALAQAREFHVRFSPDLAIESLFKVGTSAGGRCPKAVINFNAATGECYSGQVAAPSPGFTPMIIKFDEHGDVPTTRIEYSYWLMAKAAGLRMMPSNLLQCGEETHFLTERFDRNGNEKIHVQTLAAMSPAATSYEELFETARLVGVLPEEMQMLFLQTVMNVLAGNVDDHNKNFSFFMNRQGEWHISPAYDFTFTVDHSAPFYVNRHSMTINGNNQQISREDLLAIATRFNIKGADAIIGTAVKAVGNYRGYALEAGVPTRWIEIIEAEISERLSCLA